MANNLGTLSATIIAQRSLQILKIAFPVLSTISTDFSDQPLKFGQSVKTRLTTVGTTQDYDTTNGYVAGDQTLTDVAVTINKHKHYSYAFNDQEISGSQINLLDQFAAPAAYSLGKKIVDDLYALILAAGFTNTPVTQSIATTTRTTLINMGQAQNALGIPKMGRFFLLSPAAYGALAGDTTIVANLYNQANADAIESGILPNVHGYKLIEADNLPSTGNMSGFAAIPDALAMASRLPDDPATFSPGLPIPGSITTVKDPDTGLALQVRDFYDMRLGKHQVTYTLMYGMSIGNPTAGTLLVTA